MVLDANNDGHLTKDELENGLHNLCLFELFQNHANGKEDCYDEIMKQCDLNGDGKIDYMEFIQASIDHRALLNQENIKIAFDIFDSDKDGRISKEELN